MRNRISIVDMLHKKLLVIATRSCGSLRLVNACLNMFAARLQRLSVIKLKVRTRTRPF